MQADTRLSQLLELLRGEPGDVFLNYALALEFMRSGHPEKALAQLELVLSIDPAYVPAYFQSGKALEALNRNEEALKAYRAGKKRALDKNDRKAAGEFEEAIFLLED